MKFDYKSIMKIAAKILLELGILISIIFLIKNNFIIPLLLIIIGLIILISLKLKAKNEINLFTGKLLEFHKTEYKY